MNFLTPVIDWWHRVTCQHFNRQARFRLEGEYGIGYWQCLDCEHEWEDE